MKKKYCCDYMFQNIEKCKCSNHKNKSEYPDCIMDYNKKFDEYGIIIHGDPFSYIVVKFCPWCGKKLKSKREIWFSKLEKLGYLDPLFDDKIPKEFKSDKWYKN